MKQILASKDNNGRCRVTIVESVWDDSEKCYYLHRSSGVLNGKMTAAPKVKVVPKSKRNNEEQNLLMYNSLIKKYLDKGYKTIESLGHQTLDTFTEKDLPEENTNQDGVVKPMLCKVYDENDSKSQNIKWLASRKHDGQS